MWANNEIAELVEWLRTENRSRLEAQKVGFYGLDVYSLWAHNTHVGDARFTDMADAGEVNIGQLACERYGEPLVVLVGFSTHRGTVIAAREWDAPMREMRMPIARPSSWEDVLHDVSPGDQLLLFDPARLPQESRSWRGHRAIDVVYHPEYEWYGNYVPTVLPRRYDALLFVDE